MAKRAGSSSPLNARAGKSQAMSTTSHEHEFEMETAAQIIGSQGDNISKGEEFASVSSATGEPSAVIKKGSKEEGHGSGKSTIANRLRIKLPERTTWAEDHLNFEALKHVATTRITGNHGNCMTVEPAAKGGFHHIALLTFEDGWKCVGRFPHKKDQPLGMNESEVATMRYVKSQTTIPVPQVYFVNHNHDNEFGVAFMLMEHIPGTTLSGL